MVFFKQMSCLYSSSPLFSAHHNFLGAYLHFYAIKYDHDNSWRESCLTNSLIVCTLVTVKERSLTVKYDLHIAFYSGLNQNLLVHVEVLWLFTQRTHTVQDFALYHSLSSQGWQLTDRKSLLFILWVSIHWDSLTFTNQVGKLNTKLLSHYQQDKGSLNKQF